MTYALIPPLKAGEAHPNPGPDGNWNRVDGGPVNLLRFAAALDVPSQSIPAERIKSTPSPWARPLLFEQALFMAAHPAHARIVGEWRGLLAALGLWDYVHDPRGRGPKLAFQRVTFGRGAPILADLQAMLPPPTRAVWNTVLLIGAQVDGRRVSLGGTSPSTIVFTGIRPTANKDIAPWVEGGRFVDPTAYLAEYAPGELGALAQWLDATEGALRDAARPLDALLGNTGDTSGAQPASRVSMLLQCFEQWQRDTRRAMAQHEVTLVSLPVAPSKLEREVAEADPLRPLYAVVRGVTRGEGTERSVLTVQTRRRHVVANPGRHGTIRRNGSPWPSPRLSLGSGKYVAISEGRLGVRADGRAESVPYDPISGLETVDFSHLFTTRLLQIGDHAPSAWVLSVPSEHGANEDYLFPFRPEILDYVAVEEVKAWTERVAPRRNFDGSVTVTLDVPIGDGLTIAYEQTYGRDAIVDDLNPPVLALWPDFESPSWQHYYYASMQTVTRGARMRFDPLQKPAESVDVASEGLSWGRLDAPPRAWVGSDVNDPDVRGLLLCDAARRVDPVGPSSPEWSVSIDFGSTQTRVFRQQRPEEPEEIVLQPRARVLVGSGEQLLYGFFPAGGADAGAAEKGVPTLLWRPPEVKVQRADEHWLPADGHIFLGTEFDRTREWNLVGNLKWRGDESAQNHSFNSFVSQLFISVAAEAAARGARIGSIITAYPGVLPSWLRIQHERTWRAVAERFAGTAGAGAIVAQPPMSESDAVVEYLVQKRGAAMEANVLAVDIGGSTSDIAVWTVRDDERHKYLDSLQIAGSIVNRLLALDEGARDAFAAAAKSVLKKDVTWSTDAARIQVEAGFLLRRIAAAGRGGTGFSDFGYALYASGPGSPGERVLAHAAYLFAVLGFTLGMLVRRELPEHTDNVHLYLAGRGAELARWLDALDTDGRQELITHFLHAGLRFAGGTDVENVSVNVHLPERDIKEEVARGLLIPADDRRTRTAGKQRNTHERVTFAGDVGYAADAGGAPLSWSAPLSASTLAEMPRPARPVEVSAMGALNAFVDAFVGPRRTPLAQTVGRALGIRRELLDKNLRDKIHERVWGVEWRQAKEGSNKLVLEPFFLTEAKALLEYATGKPLFRD
jgi:hypothetical protein